VRVFASASILGKDNKKPVRDGESGVKHPSGKTLVKATGRGWVQWVLRLGASVLQRWERAGVPGAISKACPVSKEVCWDWGVCETSGLAFSPASGQLVLLTVPTCYCV